ncbi:hypothetical protein KDK_53120 [Dictyobacter kobayashii]|uniref:Uncharacterized protein n=1 Tax=Dictyobacter kobayashii TaxID=2014872 RepID=A0A402AQZ5_9CHLR|nr:hypothetical protein KDK_53120 [Dictyobacter kobayashii]
MMIGKQSMLHNYNISKAIIVYVILNEVNVLFNMLRLPSSGDVAYVEDHVYCLSLFG